MANASGNQALENWSSGIVKEVDFIDDHPIGIALQEAHGVFEGVFPLARMLEGNVGQLGEYHFAKGGLPGLPWSRQGDDGILPGKLQQAGAKGAFDHRVNCSRWANSKFNFEFAYSSQRISGDEDLEIHPKRPERRYGRRDMKSTSP